MKRKKNYTAKLTFLDNASHNPKITTFDDIKKFIINEEKKTVTCITWASFNCNELFVGAYTFPIQLKAIGVAQCSNNDKFDIKIGKQIASARAEIELNKQALKLSKQFLSQLAFVMNKFEIFNYKLNQYIQENINFIKKTDNENNN